MTRETGMATTADLKRLKHQRECKKLEAGKNCATCKKYGYKRWQCPKCKVYGVQGKLKDHECPKSK